MLQCASAEDESVMAASDRHARAKMQQWWLAMAVLEGSNFIVSSASICFFLLRVSSPFPEIRKLEKAVAVRN